MRDAVTKLRYVPHGAARALRSHRSQMVGAVVPSFDYALYARTTSAMQAVLDPKGYALVLAEHHYDLEAELRITEQLIGHGVDAFVFVGLHHDPALFTLLEELRPALRADLGRRPDAAASEHRLRQPRRDLRDDPPPDRARPSPLRPA